MNGNVQVLRRCPPQLGILKEPAYGCKRPLHFVRKVDGDKKAFCLFVQHAIISESNLQVLFWNPKMQQQKAVEKLAREIAACTKCPRLTVYTRGIAEKKVRRFNDWNYWGKPVPGFGDADAELLIIGLAPAAH